jgi:hypothetical protein
MRWRTIVKRFEVDDRVVFEAEGERHRGRVTAVLRGKRRVVCDTGRRLTVPVGRLRRSPDRVLILEGRLDRSLRSRRHLAPMLRRWLSAYGVEVLHERVHTAEALRQFLAREGRNVRTRFVHVISHAAPRERDENPELHLTFEAVDLLEDADLFQGLAGKILIFSCCDVGGDARCMRTIKSRSEAAAVIGYRVSVEDSYTNLHEALLYDRLLRTPLSARTVVRDVGRSLYELGIRPEDVHIKKSALVAY